MKKVKAFFRKIGRKIKCLCKKALNFIKSLFKKKEEK